MRPSYSGGQVVAVGPDRRKLRERPETVLHLARPEHDLPRRLRAPPGSEGALIVLHTPVPVALEGPLPHTAHPLLVYSELVAAGDERSLNARRRSAIDSWRARNDESVHGGAADRAPAAPRPVVPVAVRAHRRLGDPLPAADAPGDARPRRDPCCLDVGFSCWPRPPRRLATAPHARARSGPPRWRAARPLARRPGLDCCRADHVAGPREVRAS